MWQFIIIDDTVWTLPLDNIINPPRVRSRMDAWLMDTQAGRRDRDGIR
jgi:hypothetical protein